MKSYNRNTLYLNISLDNCKFNCFFSLLALIENTLNVSFSDGMA